MSRTQEERLGMFLSFVLRHKPENVGITLDESGYAVVEDLIIGMNKKNKQADQLTFELLEHIVAVDSKKRYQFSEDHKKIRCSQGHSLDVNLGLVAVKPPVNLYHGTSVKVKDFILEQGVSSRGRQFVHLSKSIDIALEVGSRHGIPFVFQLDTERMVADGIEFYCSENDIWLTSYVDPKYLKQLNL